MINETDLVGRNTLVVKAVDEFVKGYEARPAKGLIHGFQKDCIQNSWGARATKKGQNWKFEIRIVNNEKGKFLVVEDFGNLGLTGTNYSQDEISDLNELGENERLARFSAMNYSGDVTTGAGNFGRGKRMYQAASKDYMYYFDSATVDGKYYANVVTNKDKTYPRALEGTSAKEFIYQQTGFDEKKGTGTRVIIVNPKDEILDGIIDKSILSAINETWWPIILKYNATIEIYNNDELIGIGEVPEFYLKYFNDNNYDMKYKVENYNIREGYKIKKCEFFLVPEDEIVDENLMNISYYRQDMKIGNILDLYELPIEDKFKKRLFGYMEFEHNGQWEQELKENEDLQHYGILKRNYNNYKFMRNALVDFINAFCTEKGLKKENKEQEQNKKLRELAVDFTKFLYNDNKDFDWTEGKGTRIDKSLELTCDKTYPNEPHRTLNYDEFIKYNIRIKNNTSHTNFKLIIQAIDPTTTILKTLVNELITVEGSNYIGEEKTLKYDDLIKQCRNLISIKIECVDDKKIYDNASFPVFVDVPDEKAVDDFDFDIEYNRDINNEMLRLHEELTIEKFVIYNNTGFSGIVGLNVSVQDTTQRNNDIEGIYRNDEIHIDAHDIIELELPSIKFEEKYASRKGKLRIRYSLVNIEGIDTVEPFDKLIERYDSIYFEEPKPEKTIDMPFEIATSPFDDNELYLRSKLDQIGVEKYKLLFNSRYVLWNAVNKGENNSSQNVLYNLYSTEEIIKAMIKIQLKKLNMKIIGLEEGIDYEPDVIQQKIDNAVNEYIGKYFEVRK